MDIRLIILYVIGDFIFTKIISGYNPALSLVMFGAIIITPLDMVSTGFNYNFGGDRVEQNPLYERGCFRDNARFLPWLKGLKGGCYLQMGLYVFIGIAIIYRIIRTILFDNAYQYEFLAVLQFSNSEKYSIVFNGYRPMGGLNACPILMSFDGFNSLRTVKSCQEVENS